MKTRKAFLAKVLAVAVTITTILPGGGALTANAATIKELSTVKKTQRTSGDWSESFGTPLNDGGVQTWHFRSSLTDKNNNTNFAVTSGDNAGPAVVYASNYDISMPAVEEGSDAATPQSPITMSFDFYPKQTVNTMRLGILLKYVDPTHFLYLGYDQGHNNKWYMQWAGAGATYSDNSYTQSTIGLDSCPMENNKWTRVKIEYLSSSQIKVTLQNMGEDGKTPGSKVESIIGGTEYPCRAIQDIKNYALGIPATTPQGAEAAAEAAEAKPIYFGFKGGTYGSQLTDIDIANVKTNATETHEEEQLAYANCGWKSPKPGAVINDIIDTRAIGGINYVSVDALTSQSPKTIYNTNTALNDFSEGEVSAIFRPFTEIDGAQVQKAFYLGSRYSSSSDGEKSIQVGFNGTQWAYKINGQEHAITDSSAAKPLGRHDYKITMSIDGNNKLNASVVSVNSVGEEDEEDPGFMENDFCEEVAGSKIVIAEDVNVTSVPAGTISLTADAGLNLRVRNVDYSKVVESIEFANWQDSSKTTYTTVMAKTNDPAVYYKDAWEAFDTARTAKSGILTGDGVITAQGARSIINEMNAAWMALDVSENKIATGKTALETAKAEMETKAGSGYYTYDTAAYNTAKTDVEALLAKIAGDAANTVTKSEVDSALAKCEAVTFTETVADETEKKNAIEAAVSAATNGVDEADAEYYNNWAAYKSALAALDALKTNESATKKQVDDAIAALEEAVANRTLKAAEQSDRDSLKNSIAAIKKDVDANLQPNAEYNAALKAAEDLANGSAATTKKALADALKKLEAAKAKLTKKPVGQDQPKLTKGLKAKFANNDYTVIDPQKNTVALTKWNGNKKAKNANIPEKVTINGVSCTVVTVSKGAFSGFGKLTKITFGKGIANIEKGAFTGCKALKNVIFKNAKTKVAKNAFKGVKKKVTVKVPAAVKKNKKAKNNFLKMVKKAGLKKAVVK